MCFYQKIQEIQNASHLKNVVSRSDVCDVNPLAVDVVTVQIPAAHSDALIAKVGTLVPFRNTWVAKTWIDLRCKRETTKL